MASIIDMIGFHHRFPTCVSPEFCGECPLKFMCKPDMQEKVFCILASYGVKHVVHKLCVGYDVREYDVCPQSLEYIQRSLEDVLWDIKTKTKFVVNLDEIK